MLSRNSFGVLIMPCSQSPARLPCPIHDDDSGRRRAEISATRWSTTSSYTCSQGSRRLKTQSEDLAPPEESSGCRLPRSLRALAEHFIPQHYSSLRFL